MATVALGTLGASLGGSLTKTILGGTAGKFLGSTIGNSIDTALLGGNRQHFVDRHLSDIYVQKMQHGNAIPLIYGSVKIAGNIIWVSELKKHNVTTNHTAGKKGAKKKYNKTKHTYTISLAIGLCVGPISSVGKIWANDILLTDTSNIRIYLGDDDQEPDHLIEAIHGKDKTPAYRDMAYVVIQDLNITNFGNKVPNFTFEITRNIIPDDAPEKLIESIIMIPGSGEFVYDTKVQSKNSIAINQHHTPGVANSVVALDQMAAVLPNVKWVAPVVTWFCTSTDINVAEILPGVEHKNIITIPGEWEVEKYNRSNAYEISGEGEQKNYGGTVNDVSVVRYLKELKNRGYKVMFYPMIFVDAEGKPWRGNITGNSDMVEKFFHGENGYNRFILHYANLVKELVDVFIIGSEMKSLTGIKKEDNSFPAVDEFIRLAEEVRSIVGESVKITYASDWTEYHHTDGIWYNMDKLWTSKYIDFIGIDAYFSLTNSEQSEYDVKKVMAGWETNADDLGIKNIKYWWENFHTNPDGKKTEWKPKAKKIWFTEYGFPSVSCATNQPNVFPNANSVDGGTPIYSDGKTDILAQRVGIQATELYWKNSDMVERKFLWTWDARPYPSWPIEKAVWQDYHDWEKGHWVNGKMGMMPLSEIVKDLCMRAGLQLEDIDVTNLMGFVHGVIFSQKSSVRNAIEMLQNVYFFDVVESDGKLKFISKNIQEHTIDYSNIVSTESYNDAIDLGNNDSSFNITVEKITGIPSDVSVNYISQSNNISTCTFKPNDDNKINNKTLEIDLPVVLYEGDAHRIAISAMSDAIDGRIKYNFSLPIQSFSEKIPIPGDIIVINYKDIENKIKILSIECDFEKGIFEISGSSTSKKHFDAKLFNITNQATSIISNILPQSYVELLDAPLFGDGENAVYIAATGHSKKWYGCTINYIVDGKKKDIIKINQRAVIGTVNIIKKNDSASGALIDNITQLSVKLHYGSIMSIPEKDLFDVNNNQNIAIIGDEIVKFSSAKLQNDGSYIVSSFVRGVHGTEQYVGNLNNGNRFVLIDDAITKIELNHSMHNAIIKYDFQTNLDADGISQTKPSEEKTFQYNSNSARPISPINLMLGDNKFSWISRILDEKIPISFYVKINDKSGKTIYSITTKDSYIIVSEDVMRGEELTFSVVAFDSKNELMSDEKTIIANGNMYNVKKDL